MAGPLLETKFHVPSAGRALLPRERLAQELHRGIAGALTLVSAPAGFGKSSVIAQFAHRPGDRKVAWLSLDPSDSDPATFWTYVFGAVERAIPGVGGVSGNILDAAPGSFDAAVTALLNSLTTAEAELVLILDDFHVVESPTILGQVSWFLDHLPANAHVVMGTRADPAMPLARLRARGQLAEIRAADLRFTPDEAAAYLGTTMGLDLSGGDVATLEARTEGWVAALQLAALSLRGRADPSDFIEAFAGEDRHIVDYLVEEVLRQQPAETRDFLLRTSILPRFSAGLADAVTGGTDGRATIDALERGNVFLVTLDDERRWYRYHHLFAGALQSWLRNEQADLVPELHRRASGWFEQNGAQGESVEHALQAGDTDRVADLVELAMANARQFRRESTIARWVGALPHEVVARRPVLAVGYAGAILSLNQWDRVDELLDAAERQLGDATDRVVADAAEFARLPAMIELYRSALAKMRGDLQANIAHSRRVLELVGESDLGRGGAETMLGLAYWELGDLDAGFEWYAKGMSSLGRAGFVTDVVGASIIGADIRMAQARLTDAEAIYGQGLATATRTQPPLRGATDMHTGLATIAYERGLLDASRAHLDAGRRLGPELAFPRDPSRSRIVAARILQAAGDIDAAIPLLDEAERLFLAEFSPDTHPVAAIRARLLVAHGRLAGARAWAQRAAISATDELSYVREFEHATLARVLVEEGEDLALTLQLLDRLIDAAVLGRRNGSRLELLVLQALARQAAGDKAGALESIDMALSLAEPERYVRVFLDEGPAAVKLLKVAAKRSKAPGYVHEVLLAATTGAATEQRPNQALVEALSDRELEVLRLLRGDLDGPELANELIVSLNTLRTHTKNIYAKLGVKSRRAAVRRAEELDLF